MPALTPGTTLKHGTFEIVSHLGRGGFGEVYLARQTRVERDVAIKVLLPHVSENADVVTRFQREALAAATLMHPNVLTVFDFDFDEEARAWFLAMQFVPGGKTLRNLLGSPLSLAEALPLVEGIASALDAAHARGIVHRDVKPENVLLDGQRPLLADFGIAHLATMTGMTATGFAVGTPAYMSPEQAAGKPVSPKSDQYALSVIVYEMLAGRPPFIGDPISLILQHANAVPPPLASFNPRVGAAARAAVLLAMSKNPDDRYESCLELVHELEAARTTAKLTPAAPRYELQAAAEAPAAYPAPGSAELQPPVESGPVRAAVESAESDDVVQATAVRPAPASQPAPATLEEIDAGPTVARSLDEPAAAAADDHPNAARELPTASVAGPTIARVVPTSPPALAPREEEGSDGSLLQADPPPEPEAPTDRVSSDGAGPAATVARPLPDELLVAEVSLTELEETAEAAEPTVMRAVADTGPTVMRALDVTAAPPVWTEPPEEVSDGGDSLPLAPMGGTSEAPPVSAEAEDGAGAAVEIVETAARAPAVEQPLVSSETRRRPRLAPLPGRKGLAVGAAASAVGAVAVVIVLVRMGFVSGPAVAFLRGETAYIEDPGRVVQTSPTDPAAEQPAEAVPRGTVRVTSQPPGGVISVNGEPAGRAPGGLSLRPGAYDLAVSMPTFREWTQRVEVTGGDALVVDAQLEPLPALQVLNMSGYGIGREPYLDGKGLMRLGVDTNTFTVADDVNAIVYFESHSFSVRDLTFNVEARWQRPPGLPPIEQRQEQRVPRDWDETFVRACAPALVLDPRGSNMPLTLEMAIDGEVVARFRFSVGPGNPANASPTPCDPSALPTRLAAGAGGSL